MVDPRQIIHVDMDAFYASVEILDNPDLRGKAVVVGGSPTGRGVVAAASYEARKFGVHSAMPMATTIRLCPHAIVLPGRMSRYVEVSRTIHDIFLHYTPQVEPLSIDEAFLDVTGVKKLFGNSETIGRSIKADIKQQINLTASVGIAPNKFLAKLASDLEKPDGFVIITEENKQQIMDPLPVSKIWGIGKVTNKALQSNQIETIEQLRQTPIKHLITILGNQAPHILSLANGIDDREVEPVSQSKSISSERTFRKDIKDRDTLLSILLNEVEEVAQRLRSGHLEARTIALKLRYGDFKTVTRSSTLDNMTNITQVLWQEAESVFLKWYAKSAGALRLLGFGASGLKQAGSGQHILFVNSEEEKHKRIDKAFDKIKGKYGDDALRRGR